MRTLHRCLAALAVLAGGCRPADEPNAAAPAEPTNQSQPAILPAPERPLDRAALLLAVIRAASSAAAGESDAQTQRTLGGKRFAVALRLDCPRPSIPEAAREAGDQTEGALRLRARPDITLDDPLVAAVIQGTDKVEAVEGFRIARPWLLTDACPAIGPAPAAPEQGEEAEPPPASPEPAQQVAIAQFFTSDDTRAGRRAQQPFEAVVTDKPREAFAQGFRLVLAGRLRAMPNGRVIHCVVADNARPPDCLIAVDFDEVRMEEPGSGEILAQWTL